MRGRFRITYYDFNNLLYASFYLLGFEENARELGYDFVVSRSYPRWAHETASAGGREHVLLFDVASRGRSFHFCIDTRDSRLRENGQGYDTALLDTVDLYFKVNYSRDAIEADPVLAPTAHRIAPVLPFFPLRPPLWRYRPRLRPEPAAGWSGREAARRVKHLRDMPTLAWMVGRRRVRPVRDVFFVVNHYGDDLPETEFRLKMIRELRRRSGLASVAGIAERDTVPRSLSDLVVPRLSLRSYLREVAASRVAIYVRGMHDCLSFKLGQILALGKPVVGQTLSNNREAIMAHPHFDEQFSFDDVGEIVERVVRMAADPKRMDALSVSNARVFDDSFAPRPVAAALVRVLEERLESAPGAA